MRTSSCKFAIGKTSRENVASKRMAESTELGMSVHPSPIRIILIRVRGRYQSETKEATFGTNVENSDEQH